MGFFKKKADPVSERAKALNEQIAALEVQIKKLTAQETHNHSSPFAAQPVSPPPAPSPPPAAPQTPGPRQPRLRSTALPHGPTLHAASAPSELIFEDTDQKRIQESPEESAPAPAADLGTRKVDWATGWQRLKNHFRGPPTSNPKLVSYLAAGSIQGLRPLRYEKRVARNRLIILVLLLALALWGIIWIIMRNR